MYFVFIYVAHNLHDQQNNGFGVTVVASIGSIVILMILVTVLFCIVVVYVKHKIKGT